MTNTTIGLEQAIPFTLIDETLLKYLHFGEINKIELFEKMKEYNKGENRAKKATNLIYSTLIKKSKLNDVLKKKISSDSYNKLPYNDKKIILMSLVCLRFPFMWNTLNVLGKLFNIQNKVNRKYLTQSLSSVYGSNLTLERGIDATLQMAVRWEFIVREKPGLFLKKELTEISDFAKEAWIYVWFIINNKKTICIDDLTFEPIMTFLPNTNIDWNNSKLLSTKEDFSRRIWIDGIK